MALIDVFSLLWREGLMSVQFSILLFAKSYMKFERLILKYIYYFLREGFAVMQWTYNNGLLSMGSGRRRNSA